MTAAKASDVRLRIERDFVNVLEQCPRIREESSRELLVANISSRLGAELGLRKHTTTRTYVIELVHVCARQPRGLELIVDELAYLDPLAPEAPALLCLCDEWHAALTYADDMWPELRSTLHSATLTGIDDERAELAALRRLAARATGSRLTELPHHCSTLWHVFVHLAGANTLPNALPPCMVLLECVAQEINDPAVARKLRKWNRTWAERWQLTDLLDAASSRPGRSQQIHNVHLIIQIDPDPVDGNRLLVSHWRQWDPQDWRPQRGADLQVTLSTLETEIDRLIADMEIMLGTHADAANTGELWIEFVLPADLLNLPVHLWSKSPLLDEKIPLAVDHPIVVRSLERLRTPRLHLAWRRRWARRDTEGVRPYWSQPSGDDYFTRLTAELSSDHRIMTLVLSEPPEPGNETAHREINAALRAGVPAIIWHRSDCSLIEFREAVMTMIGDGAMIHLPQRIAAMRRDALRLSAATPGHPGTEVALLWDDPDRLPEPPRGIG